MEVRRLPESELTHHGILGMHWGVRRYQNQDGTLTSAGRARKNRGIIETYRNKKKMKKLRQAKEARKAEKEKIESIVKSGDAEKIKKVSHKLSEEQMARALTQLQFNAALDEYKTGKQVNTAKKGKSYLETAAATMNTISSMASAAGNIYNTLDRMGVINKPSAQDRLISKLDKESKLTKLQSEIASNRQNIADVANSAAYKKMKNEFDINKLISDAEVSKWANQATINKNIFDSNSLRTKDMLLRNAVNNRDSEEVKDILNIRRKKDDNRGNNN